MARAEPATEIAGLAERLPAGAPMDGREDSVIAVPLLSKGFVLDMDDDPAKETIAKIRYPLIGDPTGTITRNFGVMIEEEGLALRGTFVINPEGIIKTAEVHSNEIARDVKETLRKLKAAQYTAAHPNEVCPAKWHEGDATLAPSLDLVGKI